MKWLLLAYYSSLQSIELKCKFLHYDNLKDGL